MSSQSVAYGRWPLTRAKTILGENFASLEYGNCRDLPNVSMFYWCQKSISRKKQCACHWEISVSCTIENCAIVTTTYYPILVAYGRLKIKEIFKLLALKVVAVAYERRSLIRGSKDSDLTGKHLVFWKSGRWGEVVAYKRWSQPEVRLC